MPRKSNKTSYVMNLITNGEPENQEQAPQESTVGQESGQEQKAAAQPAGAPVQDNTAATGAEPDNKNVVVVDEADTTDKISEAIRQQLENNLEEQEKEAQTQQTQEDVAEGGNSSIMQDMNHVPEAETEAKTASSGDAKMSDEDIQKLFASMQAEQPEAAPAPEPAPAPASSTGDAKMSDEDIQKLFASMQAGDAAAEEAPAPEPTPAPASSSGDAKMSDEEIQKMFASMQAGGAAAEEAPAPAAPEPTPAPTSSSGDAKMSDEEIQKMFASMQAGGAATEEASAPAASEPAAAAEPVPEEEEKPYRTVNVMEAIVGRIDLEKHMKDYDVCLCGRCRADVRALMLTRLPSKYVVMNDTSVNPMLNYYEGKFKIRVYTEILRACMEVKERPRHKNQAQR